MKNKNIILQSVVLEMKELRQAQALAKNENQSSGSGRSSGQSLSQSSGEAEEKVGKWRIWKGSAEEEM